MRRTNATAVLLLALAGGVVMVLLEFALAAGGRPIIIPPITLPFALVIIGVLTVLLALPIRRLTRGTSGAPVDPFYATRVVTLAKASALAGALLTGAAVGLLLYLLTRSVIPAVGSTGLAVASALGGAVLLASGLIAEHMCRTPPRDDDDDDDRPIRIET